MCQSRSDVKVKEIVYSGFYMKSKITFYDSKKKCFRAATNK